LINIESKMQKGGRIKFDGSIWVVDADYKHPASEKEAEALNLLGFKPKRREVTSMNANVYKQIASINRNYNSTILELYDKLDSKPEKQQKVVKCFQEASNEREIQNKKFEKKKNRQNDMGHLNYREFIENALRQIEFGPDTLRSPSRRQSQKKPPNVLRQSNSQNVSTSNAKSSRQLTYSGKEIAGNKFKKTKRRKKRK